MGPARAEKGEDSATRRTWDDRTIGHQSGTSGTAGATRSSLVLGNLKDLGTCDWEEQDSIRVAVLS